VGSSWGRNVNRYCADCGRRLTNGWCLWCARGADATFIDRYEVRGVLGLGAFGRVLLARDPSLGRLVALRVMDMRGGDGDVSQQYLAAVGAVAGLTHPNCVDIYAVLAPSVGLADHVVVMEYLAGPSLEEAAKELSVRDVVRTLSGAMTGLEFLHGRSVTHGRISPGNILIAQDGESKLADAGLGEDPESPRAWALAAPEVLLGEGPSAAADVYAAAALVWWLISRTPPFEARGRQHAAMIRHRKPAGTVPPEISAVLLAALDVDPGARPSADRLRSELEYAVDFWLPETSV
jgi:serine/threonine protein kinase